MQIEHISMSPNLKSLIGNQAKLLKAVVHMLFDRCFLATFTWSGKAKGPTKNALKSFENVNELIFGAIVNIDNSYQHAVFLQNLKNKVLKYAYE